MEISLSQLKTFIKETGLNPYANHQELGQALRSQLVTTLGQDPKTLPANDTDLGRVISHLLIEHQDQ